MRQLWPVIQQIYAALFKRQAAYKMSPEAGLQTAALLAKNLRRLTPLLAFVGRQGLEKEQRLLALAILGEELDKSEDLRKDILTIISNMMGETVEFDILSLADNFPRAWKDAKMEKYVSACIKIGIFEKEDLINLSWIVNNWIQSPDAWSTAKSRLDKLKSPEDENLEDNKE